MFYTLFFVGVYLSLRSSYQIDPKPKTTQNQKIVSLQYTTQRKAGHPQSDSSIMKIITDSAVDRLINVLFFILFVTL